MAKIWRIVAVTLGVSGVGMLCGAVLGPLALWLEILRLPGTPADGEWPKIMLLGAVSGSLVGAVLAPVAAWLLMRRVTLARAIAEPACGIVIGLGAGALVHPILTIWFGVAGFFLAATRLRWMSRPAHAHDALPDA